MSSDQDRQEDELLALASIYAPDEFGFSTGNIGNCWISISPNPGTPSLEIKCQNETDNDALGRFVEHLPPVLLFAELPKNYPSRSPPKFFLNIVWLPQWQTSFVCQKLDEIWDKNKGTEILYLWIEFLRNDIFNFLSVTDTLDVTFLYKFYLKTEEFIISDLTTFCDERAFNCTAFLNPIDVLVKWNKFQHIIQFQKNLQECCICFEIYSAQKCIKLEQCNHVLCKECMETYVSLKITSGSLYIECSIPNCSFEITMNEIKRTCPQLYEKYENRMLQAALNGMNDITHCPRHSCQSPAIRDLDDTLASCCVCSYNFCSYCRKVYHGAAPCAMNTNDTTKLIEDYQKADKQQKKLLLRKYGRKQIQIVVEKQLSENYLKDNAKACPKCSTMITKIDGCNKITCISCQTAFCWLCGLQITTKNAYDHFTANDNSCYGRLFEGINQEDFNNINDAEIEENIYQLI